MAIVQTLQRTNWNKQEAAQILGLYRPTLYSKMKKHEIQDGGKSGARRSARRLIDSECRVESRLPALPIPIARPSDHVCGTSLDTSRVIGRVRVCVAPDRPRRATWKNDRVYCWRPCLVRWPAESGAGCISPRAGSRVRTQIEPKLDDFVRELANVRGTVDKARTAANEGWRSLNDITGGAQGRWSA